MAWCPGYRLIIQMKGVNIHTLSDPRSIEAKILNKQSVPAACNSCLGRRVLRRLRLVCTGTPTKNFFPDLTRSSYSDLTRFGTYSDKI